MSMLDDNTIKEMTDKPGGAAILALSVLALPFIIDSLIQSAFENLKHPFTNIISPLAKYLSNEIKQDVIALENKVKASVGKLGLFHHQNKPTVVEAQAKQTLSASPKR